jgi:hypothetical protein
MMPDAHRYLVWVHASAGAVALAAMWVPIFSKKGGSAHRKAGLVYVYAMAVATVTALVASSWRIVARPENVDSSLFLMLVAVLAGAATLYGKRVLQQKKRKQAHDAKLDLAVSLLLTANGVAGVAYWALRGGVLFGVFGALCIALGAGQLRTLRTAPTTRWFWWYEHLGAMLTACIGTVTAFLVVNYPNAPGSWRALVPGVVVWIAPGVIGGVAITLWTRHYKRAHAR